MEISNEMMDKVAADVPLSFGSQTQKLQCEICNIFCTGEYNFKAHMAGAKHKKIARNKGISADEAVTMTKFTKPSVLIPRLEGIKDPVIGIEFVTEFQPALDAFEPSAVRYNCGLCECKCDYTTIITHLLGIKHRLAYMKQFHEDYSEHMNSLLKNSEKTAYASQKAAEIEEERGRKKPEVVVMEVQQQAQPPPSAMKRNSQDYSDAPYDKRPPLFRNPPGPPQPAPMRLMDQPVRPLFKEPQEQWFEPQRFEPQRFEPQRFEPQRFEPEGDQGDDYNDNMMGPSQPQNLGDQMQDLLQKLDEAYLESEEEADLALELANKLTQALLHHKKRSANQHPTDLFDRLKNSSELSDLINTSGGSGRNRFSSLFSGSGGMDPGPSRFGDRFGMNKGSRYNKWGEGDTMGAGGYAQSSFKPSSFRSSLKWNF